MKAVFAALFAGMVGCTLVQSIAVAETATFTEKVLYSFGGIPDGAYPRSGLINVNGTLYGTTYSGGLARKRCSVGCGTAFSINPGTGVEKVVYSFCRKKGCTDGENPLASLIYVKGILYGTTFFGGVGYRQGYGTAFTLDPNTDAEKVFYTFCNPQGSCGSGANPFASLIDVQGTLYGTTQSGGNGLGTAYSLRKTGAEKVLYLFCSQQNCTDGFDPVSALTDVNGTLYGTTVEGGTYKCGQGQQCGTVFSLNPATGTETVLHSFGNGTDGAYPGASLIAVNSTLYGTTYGGGGTFASCNAGCGTVFSIDPNTGTEKVLYSFLGGTDGANPSASLIDVNGILYGTTENGGNTGCGGGGCGIVFSIDPNTGTETVLYSFLGGTDGAIPTASLLDVKGTLYGTTSTGGGTGCGGIGCGTVFALKKTR